MSSQENPEEFYRRFSDDSAYRGVIHGLYVFAFLCFLWAAWGLFGSIRSRSWEPALATYREHPSYNTRWQTLCFENNSRTIPVTRLYFAGNPPPLASGPRIIKTPATVYYNPANPEDNVVFRNPSWMTYMLLVIGLAVIGLIPLLKSAIAI